MKENEHHEKTDEITDEQESVGTGSNQAGTNGNQSVQEETESEENETNQSEKHVEKLEWVEDGNTNPLDEQVSKEDEYLLGWQRAQADLQNLKKRHDEERALFTGLGKEALLRDLIPMIDNFEAAFSNKDAWESVDQNWRVGIEYIYQQFLEVLSNNGIESYGTIGDKFDSLLHEPIESEGEGAVVKEVRQKGYKMGEKVVRPAKVVVADKP